MPLISNSIGPTWGPSGANRTQVGPMNLAIWGSTWLDILILWANSYKISGWNMNIKDHLIYSLWGMQLWHLSCPAEALIETMALNVCQSAGLLLVQVTNCMTPSYYLIQCLLVVDWILRNKMQWHLSWNTNIYKKSHLKISSSKWWHISQPQCV